MSESLIVMADSERMGTLERDGKKLGFSYAPSWLESPARYPLSLSMPLILERHSHSAVEPFLWGLLPDNPYTLESWGKRFHVSSRDPFRLLAHVGEDCAGAVRFLKENGDDPGGRESRVRWIAERDLEDRVRSLLKNHGSTRLAGDTGQFSLAGAQPKLALLRRPETGAWGVPEGSIPTTHILKPATGEFEGHVENEHFCMRLARACMLPVCSSSVIRAGEFPVIVVRRYDRLWDAGHCIRIHQEDTCQALAIHPTKKYQSEGGPGVKEIAALLWAQSMQPNADVRNFALSLIFNWLIAGTDAHGKNFSVLIAPGRQIRLAPLYDIASALPYPRSIDPYKAKLAMKIGGTYRLSEIGRSHWESCARDLRLPVTEVLALADDRMAWILDKVEDVAHELLSEGISDPIVGKLTDAIGRHVRECRERLAH
ncbi:MAG: type II toxin-antitoxin system HipA family toxin [Verrucomicrobiota bacterium]